MVVRKQKDEPERGWHQEVTHGGLGGRRSQTYVVVYNQGIFQHVVAKLEKGVDDVQIGMVKQHLTLVSGFWTRPGSHHPPYSMPADVPPVDDGLGRWTHEEGSFS